MDIHRSRFVPYPTSPINALSFSRPNDKSLIPNHSTPALKLALGRADGSVEIWSPNLSNWVQETVFVGEAGTSIDGLAWTQDPDAVDDDGKVERVGDLRLFSISSTDAVTEWDLGKGRPLRQSTGNFGQVWCLASQPRYTISKKESKAKEDGEEVWRGQDLVAGCGDGTLVVLSTAEDDLTFKRFLARTGSKKTRCMCVIWQNRERIVAGFSDSNVRIYDAVNGSLLRSMSLGVGIPGAPKDTLVWRVKCLPNGDIVSADSNGELRFWDAKTYSMTQRITGHESDCLDLITSSDGQTIFSCGLDGKVAVYGHASHGNDRKRWARLSHRRLHQGVIKAMAVYESKNMSVVLTGGADATPTVSSLRGFGKENHRKLPNLPQRQQCISATSARLMVSWWEQTVCIWRIHATDHDLIMPDAKNKKMVCRLEIAGQQNISSVAISTDGRLLIVGTPAATKAFQLRPSKQTDNEELRVRPVEAPKDLVKAGTRLVSISPDGKWIVHINQMNDINVMRVDQSSTNSNKLELIPQTAELDRFRRERSQDSGLNTYERTINVISWSIDSDMFCLADLAGYIDTFQLSGEHDSAASPSSHSVKSTKAVRNQSASSDTDSDSDSDDDNDGDVSFYGQTWTSHASSERLIKLDSPALLFSFHPNPSTKNLLFVITQHHNIYEFDIETGKLSEWSRRNPTSAFPVEFRGIKDRVMGCIWDVNTQPDVERGDRKGVRIWLYGTSWLGMLDLSSEFYTENHLHDEKSNGDVSTGKKRHLSEHEIWEKKNAQRKKPRRESTVIRNQMVDGDDAMDGMEDTNEISNGVADEYTSLEKLRREDHSGDNHINKDATGRRWWCTYKYRHVLGLVPLASPNTTGQGNNTLNYKTGDIASVEEGSRLPIEVVLTEIINQY